MPRRVFSVQSSRSDSSKRWWENSGSGHRDPDTLPPIILFRLFDDDQEEFDDRGRVILEFIL